MTHVEWHDSLPSTMVEAHRRAGEGAANGTAVAAKTQSAGRGRQRKKWEAPPGGLWLSVIARPVALNGLDALSLRVGLSIAESLERIVPGLPAIGLKWPNDLYCDGRKLGGILTEAKWLGSECRWVIVGFGLNVSNSIPESLVGTAVSLAEVVSEGAGSIPSAEQLAPTVAASISASAIAEPLSAGMLQSWNTRDVLLGSTINEPVRGTVQGISRDGALLVLREDGTTASVVAGVVTPGQ